jgi:hypothetical protein
MVVNIHIVSDLGLAFTNPLHLSDPDQKSLHLKAVPLSRMRERGTPLRVCAVPMWKSEIDAPMFCPPMNSLKGRRGERDDYVV